MKNSVAALLMLTLALGACAPLPEKAPKKTSLDIQAIQSRHFETDKNVAFAATLSVFQDLGYIVKSADKSTGFITAQSATSSSGSAPRAQSSRVNLGSFEFDLNDLNVLLDNAPNGHSGGPVNNSTATSSRTHSTAFIEELQPGKTRIRLNFVLSQTSSSHRGQSTQHDTIVEDPKTYENAFNKIGDGIFIRSANE